jgi:hypothetical protein
MSCSVIYPALLRFGRKGQMSMSERGASTMGANALRNYIIQYTFMPPW